MPSLPTNSETVPEPQFQSGIRVAIRRGWITGIQGLWLVLEHHMLRDDQHRTTQQQRWAA
jgi:hypothetical protein